MTIADSFTDAVGIAVAAAGNGTMQSVSRTVQGLAAQLLDLGAQPLAELFVAGFDETLAIESFESFEELSVGGTCRVHVSSHLPAQLVADQVYRQAARLVVRGVEGRLRAICGVIGAVGRKDDGFDDDGTRSELVLEIVPRLMLTKESRRSRIFQDMTTQQIIAAVLDAWDIDHEWALDEGRRAWAYCVQYDESDYDFVRRIAAADGLFFAVIAADFDGMTRDVVRFGDGPLAYERTGVSLPVAWSAHQHQREECIWDFTMHRAVAPLMTKLGDYDPALPLYLPRAQHAVEENVATRERSPRVTAELASVYEFAPARWPRGERAAPAANDALEQQRPRARCVSGSGSAAALAPGRVVDVRANADSTLDGAYVVTRVVSRGAGLRGSSRDYANTFEALPATAVARPERPPARTIQGLQTAIVEAPDGEEILTDALGRVKVRFHWDIGDAPIGHATCWMRVAQGWSGAAFGAFFLPRAGMEVLVAFIGGDVDRPIVVGCVPNGVAPPPYALPGSATRSGFVTRSSPGGGGSNELTFEDAAGREEILFRAERDLEQRVGRNRTVHVAADSLERVDRDARTTVGGNLHEVVHGDATGETRGARRDSVERDRELRVGGDLRTDVDGAMRTNVLGASSCDIGGNASATFRGAVHGSIAGGCEVVVGELLTARLRGGGALVVGAPRAPQPLLVHVEGDTNIESTHGIEVRSEATIVLRCGRSSITLTPDAIHLDTPTMLVDGKRIELRGQHLEASLTESVRARAKTVAVTSTQGGGISLTGDARLWGGEVHLNPPPDDDNAPRSAHHTTTEIVLRDEEGAPIANEPFLLCDADGRRRPGVLDEDGHVSIVDMPAECEVQFPRLARARDAGAPPMARPAAREGAE